MTRGREKLAPGESPNYAGYTYTREVAVCSATDGVAGVIWCPVFINGYRCMWVLAMFDLPTDTKKGPAGIHAVPQGPIA